MTNNVEAQLKRAQTSLRAHALILWVLVETIIRKEPKQET
jgi:hypothetical protein